MEDRVPQKHASINKNPTKERGGTDGFLEPDQRTKEKTKTTGNDGNAFRGGDKVDG